MSIRRRLALFFVSMLVLVTLMGGFLHVIGPMIIGGFRQSLDSMEALNIVRELRFHIVSEKSSISRYLLIDDQQEYLRFNESSKASNELLSNLEQRFSKSKPEWFVAISEAFHTADSIAKRVADNYRSGHKVKAHEEWSTRLSPKFQILIELVNNTEHQKKAQADSTFQKIMAMIEKIEGAVVVIFLLLLIVGSFLFQSLYRAVMNPLEVLERGAVEFGKGHWDHKIKLSSTNEFGSLAQAFNAMADNVKQLQLQTMHLDRMSAVGQLAGGVAHEINNPLTAVLGQAQILLAKTSEAEPQYAALKKIENAALRCRKIVRGLLDFSRPTQSTFESIDLNHVVTDTLDLCEADLRKNKINIEKKFFANLPKISGSSSELQQVFLNLINNAIQAMPKGGVLSLETRLSKKLMGGRSLPQTTVEILVRDTGIGIHEDHLTKVFEPFFTTKEIGKGTGLGLAVSMGIIKKHGGEMGVESHGLNSGATFSVFLPAAVRK